MPGGQAPGKPIVELARLEPDERDHFPDGARNSTSPGERAKLLLEMSERNLRIDAYLVAAA